LLRGPEERRLRRRPPAWLSTQRQPFGLLLRLAFCSGPGYRCCMTKPQPTTPFPCSRCGTTVICWPYQAPTICCRPCLALVRSENGRKVSAGQAPPVGATKVRKFRGSPYRLTYMPDHPDAPKHGWMMEHRLVMEQKIGRRLLRREVVHHLDHDGTNNDPGNLELCESRGQHLVEHHMGDAVAARMASYPKCACGRRMAHGAQACSRCWSKSQTCPTCGRPDRKMATQKMCHGCYKRHRSTLAR